MINNQQAIKIMKIVMVLGLCLILFGHYLLSYTSFAETYGVKGLITCGAMMAIGLIMSLPTKMYLTFVFVKNENERKEREKLAQKKTNT